MDSFEINKLIGGFLATCFVVFSLSIISDSIFAAPVPEKPGYAIEAAEEEGGGGEAGAPAEESVLPLLAGANVENGNAVHKKCAACHTVEKGGANKTGPNLWGIVDRPIASHEGFAYSAALKDFSQGGSVKWDYEHLDKFLTSPKGLVKGTAMGFAGIKKTQERADLIAYLRTLADTPAPLPAAGAAPENASAPADGAAAPAEKPAEGAAPAEKPAEEGTAPAPAEGTTPAAPAPAAPAAPAPAAPAEPAPAAPAPAAPAAPAEPAPANPN
jgi:cytochrome c